MTRPVVLIVKIMVLVILILENVLVDLALLVHNVLQVTLILCFTILQNYYGSFLSAQLQIGHCCIDTR